MSLLKRIQTAGGMISLGMLANLAVLTSQCSVLLFVPDSNPTDGIDDSFLYIGWDIADRFTDRPGQYDADWDKTACSTVPQIHYSEGGSETYAVMLGGCKDLSQFASKDRYTSEVYGGLDSSLFEMFIHESNPASASVLLIQSVSGLETISFPTANGVDRFDPNATNPTNNCIDEEVTICGAKACNVSDTIACEDNTDCPDGEECEKTNNIELIIKRVETSGLFGPHGRKCSISGITCYNDGAGTCSTGETCDSIVIPDSPEARENRMALAQLVALLSADAQEDNSDEESAVVAVFTSLPKINVTKKVRCVEVGTAEFSSHVEALPGSQVEFQITITNTGNELLTVTVDDVMQAIGTQAGFVNITPVCDFFEAELTSPRRGLIDFSVTPFNANLPPICDATSDPECLKPNFFGTSCPAPPPWGLFLEGVRDGVPVELGGLLGCVTSNGVDGCEFTEGDTLVIRFRADVDVTEDFCDEQDNPDAENGISVYGALPSDPTTEVTRDEMKVADTDLEIIDGGDDNVATVNLLCRDIEFEKQVRVMPTGVFTNDLDILPFTGSFVLEYRYEFKNKGETDENITLTDDYLCEDIGATAGVSIMADLHGLCTSPEGQINDTVEVGVVSPYSVLVRFDNYASLIEFMTKDDARTDCTGANGSGDHKESYYRNCASVTSVATNVDDICNGSPPLEAESEAQIHIPQCDIEVTKQVRCVNQCLNPTEFGDWVGSNGLPEPLRAAAGSCVQYEIVIKNTGDLDICQLSLKDNLTGDITYNENSFSMQLNGVDVASPPDFNTTNTPVLWDAPSLFVPEDTITIRFTAQISEGAVTNPQNEIKVEAAVCNPTPVYDDCEDEDEVAIDIVPASLQCLEKTWQFMADTNCDGVPDGTFSAPSTSIDLRDQIFPVRLKMCVTAENTGQVPLMMTVTDTALIACLPNAPLNNELGTPKLVAPGAQETWCVEFIVDTAEQMRAMDVCDGTEDSIYQNTASVTGTLDSGDTDICVPEGGTVEGDTCSAEILVPEPCSMEITKQVKCLDDPAADYDTSATAAPGSTLTFRIQIENTGTITKIPQVCLKDALNRQGWWDGGSVTADIAGDDVTADFGAFSPDGGEDCFDFPSRPLKPYIGPGEVLTITFNVVIPPDFSVPGINPDCVNQAEVGGYTECGPGDESCAAGPVEAKINVIAPDIACDKQVCFDIDTNGQCGSNGFSYSDDQLIEPGEFPISIIYRYKVHNPGETDLENTEICDPDLIADVNTIGLILGDCELDPTTGCVNIGTLAAEAESDYKYCSVKIPSIDEWLLLIEGSIEEGCYYDRAIASADPVVDDTVCATDLPRITSDLCTAKVCMGTPCEQCCPPVTKAKFDIWNMNEFKFSGTERCICSWDETLLSDYTLNQIANHFRRYHLQTDKGKARIFSMASDVVCPPSITHGPPSMDAPLIGTAATKLTFNYSGDEDHAGFTLIGAGTEAGQVRYTPSDPPPSLFALPYNGNPDITARASTSQKGSFLAFLEVVLRKDTDDRVIEDTVLTLINDHYEDVNVQLFLVSGDTCDFVDTTITITGNGSGYWTASNGSPDSFGLSPFDVLEGCADTSPDNPGGMIWHGYVLAFAVDSLTNQEIYWNQLSGTGTVINYGTGGAWQYPAWAFQAVGEPSMNGQLLNQPYGQLDFDGIEYDFAPSMLVMDFLASDATFDFSGSGNSITTDTKLILWAVWKDLSEIEWQHDEN